MICLVLVFFLGGAGIFLEARVESHHTLTQCPSTRVGTTIGIQ